VLLHMLCIKIMCIIIWHLMSCLGSCDAGDRLFQNKYIIWTSILFVLKYVSK
jgi:hypothetical protein